VRHARDIPDAWRAISVPGIVRMAGMNGELEALVPLIPRHDVSGPRPIDLLASEIHLGRDGEIRAGRRGAGGDRDGWRLTAFHAKTADDVHADHWEMHPEADEIVSCVVGKIRLFLRPDGRGEEVVRLGAGTAAIVPRGRWHRIELDIPSTILAVTLPHGTRLERRTGAERPDLARPEPPGGARCRRPA
jgi:hypothetical protein